MLKVEFEYKSNKTFIQAINEDKMRQVCSKFTQKAQINLNKLYFMYSGNIVNLELTIEQIINKTDKERGTMSIIVVDHSNESGNNNKIISPYIICPICKEHARYELKNYRIRIFNCKNGHVIDDILIKDFESTQMIDESLIICDKCKKNNKSNTYNNEMYRCNECNMNLCPLCKSNHDKKHTIIDYEQKYYICNIHNKEYNSYCETCKKDLCEFCKNEHKNHEYVSYSEIIPKDLEKINNILNITINSFLKSFNAKMLMIIDKINNIMKNSEIYIKLVQRNLVNYNINNINYNILQNINYNYKDHMPKFGDIWEDLCGLGQDNSYKEFIPRILNMYNGMNKNEIDLIYNIPNNAKDIKIFGEGFVETNKDLCKIIYNNKEYDLSIKFDCKDIKENLLKIKLKGINNVTILDSMFEGCSQLSNLSNFSNMDTSYAILMNNLFKNCKCLELPDISNWNTHKVFQMIDMFSGCSSLKSLPDISNWNTSNVFQMNHMFSGSSSLISLPDISKWNTNNVGVMSYMFSGCSSLISLPDISDWNTSNVGDMSYMFSGCSSLKSLPNISKWDISLIFKSKDIDTKENGLTGMFDGCSESLNIPEKFKEIE